MKKTILSTILLSGLVLSVAAPIASAAEADNSSTDVEVVLEKEDDGHNEGNGDYFGKLAIVWKPTRFQYQGKTSGNDIFMANNNEFKKRNFIAVNDDRRDETTSGQPIESDPAAEGTWKLSGKLNELTHSYSGKELDARLQINPEAPYIYNIGPSSVDANNNRRYEPKPIPNPHTSQTLISDDDDLKNVYDLKSDFTLESKGDAIEFLSKKDSVALDNASKRGIFTNLGNNNITVLGDSGKEAGIYNGTITWTLEDSL